MEEKILNLIAKTFRVGDVLESININYQITDGGGYGDNQLLNFYNRKDNNIVKQLFINPEKRLIDLSTEDFYVLSSLLDD